MPQLTMDPNLESCPDFSLDFYQTLRSQLAQGLGMTEDEAAQKMADSWKLDHDARVQTWAGHALAPSSLLPRPSQFAKKKVANYDFVDLWYFTYAGCVDAAKSNRGVTSEDTYGITRSDDMLALAPVSLSKPSDKMEAAKWPKEYIMALAEFFFHIDSHPMRHEKHGEKTLLLFQARVPSYANRERSKLFAVVQVRSRALELYGI
ncbi:hypothetical protein R3P38DRAFT_3329955 [Favolaschia claudopus]|uniref:Uncharacterized protein n=1 Tax=Favolaschia claudopus TaxID=2862362 RepID=A0AAV9ZW48_9AGAR